MNTLSNYFAFLGLSISDCVSGHDVYNHLYDISEAVTQKCSEETIFWKYAADLQENTHANVWFQ